MTGEMVKPPNAEKDESYWRDKTSNSGTRVIGDEMFLIRPNYPEFFDIWDRLKAYPYIKCDVQPFDVYNGPYISVDTPRYTLQIWADHETGGENLFLIIDSRKMITPESGILERGLDIESVVEFVVDYVSIKELAASVFRRRFLEVE